MAPKGTKRPAAAAAAGPPAAKKPAREAAKKCDVICAALSGAAGPLPEAVLQMLSKALPDAVLTYSEERHEFQVTSIQMAGQALASIEAEMKAAIVPLEAKVAGAELEDAARKAAQEAAQADLDAKRAEVPKQKEASDTSKAALGAAIGAVGDAEKAQKAGDVEADHTVKLKEQTTAFVGTFETLKTTVISAKDLKAALKSLDALTGEFGFDAEIMESANSTLALAPDARGTFDGMIVAEVEKLLVGQLAELEAAIADAAPAKEARAAAVEAAMVARTAANDQNTANSMALDAAHKAQTEAEAALKAAAAAVKGFSSEAHAATKECKHAQDKLATFQAGALAAFVELEAYAKPLPPPEPVVEEPAPVAEEPAAPAEPAPMA